MKIVVTGATGFVGRHVVPALLQRGHEVIGLGRGGAQGDEAKTIPVGDMTVDLRWEEALDPSVDAVIHLAGYAHDVGPDERSLAGRYQQVNVDLTERVATRAAQAGVRRFVYVSSVKTMGEASPPGAPFTETDSYNPVGAYASSKVEAEGRLAKVAKETGLELVIVRPPLVYGPGVKANMKSMVDMVTRRRLIPVPSVGGKRSFIYVGNLVDALSLCAEAPEAAGETFLVSDGDDKTVDEMIHALGEGADRRVMTLPIPDGLARLAAALGDGWKRYFGRSPGFDSTVYQKIVAPLQVDSGKIRNRLGWRPPHSTEAGAMETMRNARRAPVTGGESIWGYVTPPLAAAIAFMVNYDFFQTAGGLLHYAPMIVIFSLVQYTVDWWLHLDPTIDTRSKRTAQLVKGALGGAIGATFVLFVFYRLDTVPRLALLLYPLVLGGLRLPTKLLAARPYHSPRITGAPIPAGPSSALGAITPAPLTADAPLASVIVVNYNGGELLTECVKSALASTAATQVIVSDNASRDGSVEYLERTVGADPRLVVLRNGANLGFAKGNNVAIPYATGRYLLFLNPDCIMGPDVIPQMATLMDERPDAGMAGCLIRNLDGSEQVGCRRAVPTPWRTFVRILHLNTLFPNHPLFRSFVLNDEPLPKEPVAIEALSGAFMFVRREALAVVGPLDEAYFMHCEDLDWCMRFRAEGYAIVFTPDVEITHVKGACSRETPNRVHWYKHRGMVRFYWKFFRHQYPSLMMWGVTLSVWLRFAAIVMVGLFKKIAPGDDRPL